MISLFKNPEIPVKQGGPDINIYIRGNKINLSAEKKRKLELIGRQYRLIFDKDSSDIDIKISSFSGNLTNRN
jgi:hypothetical protein